MSIIFILCGAVLCIAAFIGYSHRRRIENDGVDIEATVIGTDAMSTTHDFGITKSYAVTYAYTVDGKHYESIGDSGIALGGGRLPYADGDKVMIKYLRSNPRKIAIPGTAKKRKKYEIIIIAAGIGFIAAGLINL